MDDAAIATVKTAEQQEILEESVEAAQRALEIANTRYREGYADFQRVLDAQRALFSQEERQLLNHGSHISSVVALYKGSGGGWVRIPGFSAKKPEGAAEKGPRGVHWVDGRRGTATPHPVYCLLSTSTSNLTSS